MSASHLNKKLFCTAKGLHKLNENSKYLKIWFISILEIQKNLSLMDKGGDDMLVESPASCRVYLYCVIGL